MDLDVYIEKEAENGSWQRIATVDLARDSDTLEPFIEERQREVKVAVLQQIAALAKTHTEQLRGTCIWRDATISPQPHGLLEIYPEKKTTAPHPEVTLESLRLKLNHLSSAAISGLILDVGYETADEIYYLIKSEPVYFGSYLGKTPQELDELSEELRQYIRPPQDPVSPRTYATGALIPSDVVINGQRKVDVIDEYGKIIGSQG